MPLFCISLLALLLLPLSLSCESNRPPVEVRNDYMAIVQTELDRTKEIITTLLQNTSCPELRQRLRSCTPNAANVVSTLHNLTCKMKTLMVSHTDQLVGSVLHSIHCTCREKPTKEPSMKFRRRRTAARHRRNEQTRNKKETKKLCKAVAFLSNMTECYEMLNTQLVHN